MLVYDNTPARKRRAIDTPARLRGVQRDDSRAHCIDICAETAVLFGLLGQSVVYSTCTLYGSRSTHVSVLVELGLIFGDDTDGGRRRRQNGRPCLSFQLVQISFVFDKKGKP